MLVSVAKNDRWHLALIEGNYSDRYRYAGLALPGNDVFQRLLANFTTVLDCSESCSFTVMTFSGVTALAVSSL